MHYIARSFLEGAVPYKDFIDMNFPGTYLIHSMVIKIMGDGNGAWRFFDIICLVLINILIIAYCCPFGTLSVLFAVSTFSCFHLYNGPLYIGQRDYILVIFLLGSLYAFVRYVESRFAPLQLMLSALSLGAAITIKPFAAILFPCVIFALFLVTRRSGTIFLRHGLLFIASFVIIPLLSIAWLWKINALTCFYDIVVNYLIPLYSRLSFSAPSLWLLQPFLYIPIFILIVLIAIIGIIDLLTANGINLRRATLIVGIIYGLFHYIVQRGLMYQIYPAFLFAMMLVASWIQCLAIRQSRYIVVLIKAIVISYIAVSVAYISSRASISEPYSYKIDFPCTKLLVNDLQGKVSPSETVQVMDCISGALNGLYILHCKQPTRVLYDGHLFHDIQHPYIQALRKEFLDDLKLQPPAYFVISKVSWPIFGYDRIKTFPELETWLGDNFVLYSENECYRLYRIINRPNSYDYQSR